MAGNSSPTSLDHLNDIVVADPVPFWPPAPGWYFLAAICFVAALSLTVRRILRRRDRRYRRQALKELNRLQAECADPTLRPSAIAALPGLVKRVALTAYGRNEVAGLDGPPYLELLDQSVSGHPFVEGAGRHLPRLSYDPAFPKQIATAELHELFVVLQNFIQNHATQLEAKAGTGGTANPC